MAALRRSCCLAALAAFGAEGLRSAAPPAGGQGGGGKRQIKDEPHRHVIAMKEHKLAFCYVQKVASEHFGPMFNAVNNISGGLDPEYSSLHNLGIPWPEVTRENGWKFAMFVRDPLERYLSAFLSKCLPTGGNKEPVSGGKNCHGPTRSAPVSQEEKVALFEERVRTDLANGLPTDDHWLSHYAVMQRHCGADKFEPAKLDYVGRMTYDLAETNSQVQGLLKLTSLAGVEALATQHFPAPSPLALLQCPGQHCTRSYQDFDTFYKNPETVRIVVQIFKDDYAKFSLPLPAAAKGQAA